MAFQKSMRLCLVGVLALFFSALLFSGGNGSLLADVSADEIVPTADPDQQSAIESSVVSLLKERCWSCHGPSKQEGGLRLDQRERILAGGDNGRIVSPGTGDSSRLVLRVVSSDPDERMPPEGDRLPPSEVQLLTEWIDRGLAWPTLQQESPKNPHWAYQPIAGAALPAASPPDATWVRNEIDLFVLPQIQQAGLEPSPEAPRSTLIRRVTLDLIGLLPTREEIEAFEQDGAPDAWEKVIDRLLSSPHFGERWGRHWLDMARYADSDGYEKDNARPDAWRWRDWVIDAINRDLPFDQFTIEQLAGDLLPDATPMQRLATAFHRQTLTNTEGGTDQEQLRVEACFDRTETTGTVWLGLTVGCARCHTHKYDAITQREYYQLFSVFNNGDEATMVVPRPQKDVDAYPLLKKRYDEQLQELHTKLKDAQEAHRDEFSVWRSEQQRLLTAGQLPKSAPKNVLDALPLPEDRLSKAQQRLLMDFWSQQHALLKPLIAEVEALQKSAPEVPEMQVRILTQRVRDPRKTRVFRRGEFLQPMLDFEVQPASPATLPPLQSRVTGSPPDRLDFARWLVAPDNPLTPRVAVNHLWARLFGHGLVRTVADFGVRGDRPSHPELLDWLAARFAGLSAPATRNPHLSPLPHAWSRKDILRLILTSATYKQSSRQRPDFQAKDPTNTLLWRQNRLRVEGEIVRDISLQAAGILSEKIGGPSVFPPLPAGVAELSYAGNFRWVESSGEDRYRRGMYTFFKRTAPHPGLTIFDCPDANLTCAQRSVSNTPLQALVTLNNEVFAECARRFAQRILRAWPGNDHAGIEDAFAVCTGRLPEAAESQELLRLLHESEASYATTPELTLRLIEPLTSEDSGFPEIAAEKVAAWINVCRLLLNLDEFITRE